MLRLYEAGKTAARCRVSFGVPVASVRETDMLEEKGKKHAVRNGAVTLRFKPFEVKTLVCRPGR